MPRLTVAALNGVAQRERWRREDHLRDPYPQVAWTTNEQVQGKYRTLGLWTTNVLTNPIRLISIEALSPSGSTFAAYADGSRKLSETPGAVAILNRPILGNYFDDKLYVALNLPNTPNDRGDFVELRANFEETTSPPRHFSQMVRTYIPAGAEKR
jgi:hypothetical protein